MRIDRLNTQGVRPRAASSASAAGTEGFSELVEARPEEAAAPVLQTQPLATATMLPPLPQSGAAQDREAKRHGGAMLRALGGLQLAMLGAHESGADGGGAEALRGLADLARQTPGAADPALDQVLRAIAQRAAIELARAG